MTDKNIKVQPIELAPGLFRVDTPLGERCASLYVIAGADEVLIYDAGIDGTIPLYLLPALSVIGRGAEDVSTVVVSHCDVDHFGGVADARSAFPNARIVAGAADLPLIEDFDRYLRERGRGFVDDYGWDEDPAVLDWCRSVTRETTLDGAIADGEKIDLGGGTVVEVLAVPGHSHGHLAIDIPHADAVLVGDAVLGASVDLADGTPAFPPTYRFVNDYLDTVRRLEMRRRNLLLTAHYPTMRGNEARDFLRRSRDFAERLDGLVAAALAGTPDGLTFAELLEVVNPVAGEWPEDGTIGALAFPVAGHLERRVDLGEARRLGERNGVAVWATT